MKTVNPFTLTADKTFKTDALKSKSAVDRERKGPLFAPSSYRTADEIYAWAPNELRPYMAASQNYVRSQPDLANLELEAPDQFKQHTLQLATKIYSMVTAMRPEGNVKNGRVNETVGYPSGQFDYSVHPFGLAAPVPQFGLEVDRYTDSKSFDPGYSPNVKLVRVVDCDPTLRDGYLLVISNVPFNCESSLRVWTIMSALGFHPAFIEALINYADKRQPTPL